MRTSKRLLFLILAPILPVTAFSQTTFSGGDLDSIGNWNNGLPNTIGNDGSVSVNGQFDTAVTGRQWVVNQTGGTMTANPAEIVSFGGGSWTISGASSSWDIDMFDFTNFAVSVENGGTFNQDSSGNSFLRSGSSITIDGTSQLVGSGSVNENFRFDGGILNVDGGSATDFAIRGGSGTINLDGGTVDMTRNRGIITLNLLSSGTFGIGDNRTDVIQNWSVGSTAQVTLAGSGSPVGWAESDWNAGAIFYNGQDFSTLGDWSSVSAPGGLGGGYSFDYSGQTLSIAVPEPSMAGLLVGLLGLAFSAGLRRRR